MARLDQVTLRFELLRMRASVEREELRGAVIELRNATQPLCKVLGAASRIAQRIEGRRGGVVSLAGALFGSLRDHPWLLSTLATIATRRGLRRWLLLGGVAALGVWFARGVVGATKAGDAAQ